MKTVKIKASSEKRWGGEGKNKRREPKKKIMRRRKNIQDGKEKGVPMRRLRGGGEGWEKSRCKKRKRNRKIKKNKRNKKLGKWDRGDKNKRTTN